MTLFSLCTFTRLHRGKMTLPRVFDSHYHPQFWISTCSAAGAGPTARRADLLKSSFCVIYPAASRFFLVVAEQIVICIRIEMWNKILPRIWKFRQAFDLNSVPFHSVTVSNISTSYKASDYGRYLIPFSLLTFGLAKAKCDTNSDADSYTPKCGKRIPECAPKCSKEDLDKLKCPKQKCSQSCAEAATSVDHILNAQVKQCEPEELTHSFMLKQSAGLIVDAVTRLLTQTVCALDDYHQQYREMMGMLLALLEEGRSASSVNLELLNCKMIVLRSQMEDVRQNLNELEMFLTSVEALVNQTAQTAYLARAEYPSIALSERLQSALIQVSTIKGQTKELESDLIQLQAVVIVESGKSLK